MTLAGRGALVIVAGGALSWVLYPLTHPPKRRVPELFGIAAGCMLVNAALYWLWRDDETLLRAFVAQALVGLGVAGNRVRLELWG